MSKSLDVFGIDFRGHHLIEAAAGTGKTYNITALYIRALIEKTLLPSQVLVLTFTNDATSELKERIRKRIQEVIKTKEGIVSEDEFANQISSRISERKLAHLKKCLFQFDEAAISTIHGFCQKVLSEHHLDFNVNPNFSLETDTLDIIQEAADQFWDEFFFEFRPSTKFEKWYQNYLNLVFQSPDKLLDTINPLITNADIKVEPAFDSLDISRNQFETTKRIFKKTKEAFHLDEEEFLRFYYSDALHKNSYRNRDKILEDFKNWLNLESECPSTYSKLNLFGNDMPNRFTKKGYEVPELRFFSLVDEYIAEFEELRVIEIVFQNLCVQRIREKVDQIKKKRSVLGYQNLLTTVRDGLGSSTFLSAKLANRFPIAFIDEFQDTDHIQYSIFKSMYSDLNKTCLVMIGDPKQAIYRFRGADMNTYLAARNFTKQQNRYSLLFNYRASRKMIKAVNAFFHGKNNPFENDGLSFEPAQFPDKGNDVFVTVKGNISTPFTLISINTDNKLVDEVRLEIANSVAFEISQLFLDDFRLNNEPVYQNDIAVLVDTHRNAELVQEVLREYGLKSSIRSKSSVFHSDESIQLYKILHAVASPTSEGYIRSALLTKMFGFTALNLLENDFENEELNRIQTLLIDINASWEKKGLAVVFKKLELDFEVLKHLASHKNPERSITNYKHLKELLLNAERIDSLSVSGVLNYFKKKRDKSSLNVSEEEVIRLESDEEFIQIVTHHASKGLEYPIVFCPFLWNFSVKKSKIPITSTGLSQTGYLDPKSDDFVSASQLSMKEDQSEKIRLVYVAMTRAKAMCFIYHNTGATVKGKSGFNTLHHLMDSNSELDHLLQKGEVIKSKDLEFRRVRFKVEKDGVETPLRTEQFTRTDLGNFSKWASFSSLTQKKNIDHNADLWGFDFDEDERRDSITSAPIFDKFSLPKGKATGNLLHNIFEQIDFADENTFSEVIDNQLAYHGFDPNWKSSVFEIIKGSTSHHLIDGVSLSRVQKSDRLVEMEFNFPLNQLNSSDLFQAIGSTYKDGVSSFSGFMKGFIDLIFRCKGKYYILDYKSNHLGDAYSSYSKENLSKEMLTSSYDLQYHIYLVAFKRFIQLKKPDFNYESDFGGVIYLFLRGVNPQKPESGVYFNKPKLEVVEQLDEIMNGCN